MAAWKKKAPTLKDSTKLRVEVPTEIIQHIITREESETQDKESKVLDAQAIQPSDPIARHQPNRSKPKMLLLAVAGIALVIFALVDLSAHNFADATAKHWMSAFAVIGAAVSLRRAIKRAFKKTADGTVYLLGEDPDKAAMPSCRTYLIMLFVFLIFVAIIAYAGYNSAMSGRFSL